MSVDLDFLIRPRSVRVELVMHPKRLFRLLLFLSSTTLCRAVMMDSVNDWHSTRRLRSFSIHSNRLFHVQPSTDEMITLDASQRTLLQARSGSEATEQTQTESLVALIVIISVALLFLFKICICMIRVSQAEREAEQHASAGGQGRSRRSPPPPLPVLFINPGGSVRIGKKLKTRHDESYAYLPEEQPVTNQLYLFGEAEVYEESSGSSSSPQPNTRPLLQE